MDHPLPKQSLKSIDDPLQSFYDSLCSDARQLVRSCGSILHMEDEADRILHEVDTPDAVPIPSLSLLFSSAARLKALLHPPRGVSRDAETIEVLARVISLYAFATATVGTSVNDVTSHVTHSKGNNGRSAAIHNRRHEPPAQTNNNSNNNNNNNNDVQATHHETIPMSSSAICDAQLAEEIYSAVTDAVVTCAADGDSPTTTRIASLYAFASSIARFSEIPLDATRCLPVLFPEVDATRGALHPLLTPLLLDSDPRVQCAAASAITALVQKLHQSLQYAEEPTQRRQSFASLASQCGRALVALHDGLLWGLSCPPPAAHALCFTVFASLVRATPYRRCPRARNVLRAAMDLSLLRDALLCGQKGEDFAPAAAFLAQCLRAESIAPLVRAQLTGGVETDHSLLHALFAHAASRAEVWRCVAQIARYFPECIGAHFDALMDASRAVLHHSLHSNNTENQQEQQQQEQQEQQEEEGDEEAQSALAECLRAWLYFMGYVWESFDGRPSDPAARPEHSAHRATTAQREVIVRAIVAPALSRPLSPRNALHTMGHCPVREMEAAVCCTALRCIAQVGDGCLSSVDHSTREALVAHVVRCTMANGSAVRAEAFTTIGVWAWQYNAFAQWLPEFVDRAVSSLCDDAEPSVRFKAAFALSNITSRLKERRADCPLRRSPRHMQLLCDIAMRAARAHGDAAVVGHGIRMMSHLLESLSVEELIGELSDEQTGVAEGYFTALLRFLLPSNRDAKLRWNAACALGLGLSREETFEADPKLATQSVERLCVIVCHDRIFKVRTQAAGALARVPMSCLAAGRYAKEDLTPKLTRALCNALQASLGTTDNFAQYKEQGALSEALRSALGVIITGAASSEALQHVFAEYRTLLEENGLL